MKNWCVVLLGCLLATPVMAGNGSDKAEEGKVKVVAHRGFWKTDGSAQNSIASLVKADSVRCYASEFDVWLTADGDLVVNHDNTFKGVTIEKATSKQCTAVVLDNGQHLPTLRQYLKQAGKLGIRLVLELKPHSTPEQETEAVAGIVKMVRKMKLEHRTDYITFSLHAMREFIRVAPAGTAVYYLNGDLTPQELKAAGAAGSDYYIGVFRSHPEWVKECHDLGMRVNAWTVDKEEDMKWLIDLGVDFITTNEPLRLQHLLKSE